MASLRLGLVFALSFPATASSPYDMNEIAENPEMALPAYLYEQFSSYSTHSSGGLGVEGIERQRSLPEQGIRLPLS
jgi:hypothetical protein